MLGRSSESYPGPTPGQYQAFIQTPTSIFPVSLSCTPHLDSSFGLSLHPPLFCPLISTPFTHQSRYLASCSFEGYRQEMGTLRPSLCLAWSP